MNRLQKFAVYYLAVLLFMTWGFAIGKYEVFPYAVVQDFLAFAAGHPEEGTSFVEKVLNDADVNPYRHYSLLQVDNSRNYKTLAIPGAKKRRAAAQVYLSDGAQPGYRLIHGVFDFEAGLHGAILLDTEGRIVHHWVLHENGLPFEVTRSEQVKYPHGILPQPDGSLIFTFDFGSSIQRFDWCGRRLWATPGLYNHAISPDEGDRIWAVGPTCNGAFSQFDIQTGKLLRELPIEAIYTANPEIDILGIRQDDRIEGSPWLTEVGGQMWHANDVEPLPAALAGAFPQFAVGDLLLNFRSLNLVCVVDPSSLKVKWWRVGQWRRQHDADWQPDGTITVYDNNMHRRASRIVKIDPETNSVQILAGEGTSRFYSYDRGKHQVLPNGNILFSVPLYGSVREVTPDGRVVFEFLNIYDKEKNLTLSVAEAVYLPPDFYDLEKMPSCSD